MGSPLPPAFCAKSAQRAERKHDGQKERDTRVRKLLKRVESRIAGRAKSAQVVERQGFALRDRWKRRPVGLQGVVGRRAAQQSQRMITPIRLLVN